MADSDPVTADPSDPKSTAGGAISGRRRDPTYDVFEQRTLHEPPVYSAEVPENADDGPGRTTEHSGAPLTAWVLIAEGVKAPGDREAIKDACQRLGYDEDRCYGTFWAPLAGTFKPRNRGRELVPQDVWT